MHSWIILILLVPTASLAHHAESGWLYPPVCCTPSEDCYQLPDDKVVRTSKGYYIPHLSAFVPYMRANTSPDGHFHVCEPMSWDLEEGQRIRDIESQTTHQNRSSLCFWAPEPAF